MIAVTSTRTLGAISCHGSYCSSLPLIPETNSSSQAISCFFFASVWLFKFSSPSHQHQEEVHMQTAPSPPSISPHHSLPTEATWDCVSSYSYSNVRGANSSRAGLFYIRRKSSCINSLLALSPFFCSFCLQLFPPIPQESWDTAEPYWAFQNKRYELPAKASLLQTFLCRKGH